MVDKAYQIRGFQVTVPELGESLTLGDIGNIQISGSPIYEGSFVTYDSATGKWKNTHPFHFIDIEGTTLGSPTPSIIEHTLPVGWTTTYNGVGDYTITHNHNDPAPGLGIMPNYGTKALIVNIFALTNNTIQLYLRDTGNIASDGRISGIIAFFEH